MSQNLSFMSYVSPAGERLELLTHAVSNQFVKTVFFSVNCNIIAVLERIKGRSNYSHGKLVEGCFKLYRFFLFDCNFSIWDCF